MKLNIEKNCNIKPQGYKPCGAGGKNSPSTSGGYNKSKVSQVIKIANSIIRKAGNLFKGGKKQQPSKLRSKY